MTDQVPDGGQGSGEGAALATPTFTSNPVVAPSEKAFDEDALVSKIVDRLSPEIEKRVQSVKDKRFGGLEKLGGVDELLRLKDYIKQQGGDVDKGVREYQIDQLLNQAAPQGSAANGANRSAVDTTRVQQRTTELLNDAGISPTDPDYLALVNKTYAAPEDWYHAVSRFAVRRGKQTHVPGPESGDGGSGGRVPVSGDRDAKLDKLYGELRLAQQGTDRKDRERITKEIKALGGHA
jgi:hypothetical protein